MLKSCTKKDPNMQKNMQIKWLNMQIKMQIKPKNANKNAKKYSLNALYLAFINTKIALMFTANLCRLCQSSIGASTPGPCSIGSAYLIPGMTLKPDF